MHATSHRFTDGRESFGRRVAADRLQHFNTPQCDDSSDQNSRGVPTQTSVVSTSPVFAQLCGTVDS
jgi:hypothetical protein